MLEATTPPLRPKPPRVSIIDSILLGLIIVCQQNNCFLFHSGSLVAHVQFMISRLPKTGQLQNHPNAYSLVIPIAKRLLGLILLISSIILSQLMSLSLRPALSFLLLIVYQLNPSFRAHLCHHQLLLHLSLSLHTHLRFSLSDSPHPS